MASYHHKPENIEFEFNFKIKAKVDQLGDFFKDPAKSLAEGQICIEDLKQTVLESLTEEIKAMFDMNATDVDYVTEYVRWSVTSAEVKEKENHANV